MVPLLSQVAPVLKVPVLPTLHSPPGALVNVPVERVKMPPPEVDQVPSLIHAPGKEPLLGDSPKVVRLPVAEIVTLGLKSTVWEPVICRTCTDPVAPVVVAANAKLALPPVVVLT